MTSSEQWRYVATEDNPADFISRGMDSLKLKTCELWWNGPKFLMSNQYPQRQIPVAVIKDPGRSITSIVEPDLTNLNENRLDNWQKITKIIQLIWKRWSVDYLNSLQQRNKWHFEKKNAKIGDMVIIKEDNLPSCQWSLGRINNIYPGKDSKVTIRIDLKIDLFRKESPSIGTMTSSLCSTIVTVPFKVMEVCAVIQWDIFIDHQAPTDVIVNFSDIRGQVAGPWFSPNENTAKSITFTVIVEQDVVGYCTERMPQCLTISQHAFMLEVTRTRY
ncbi:DUF5641 domain-containing protein [Trichonephila clavipes]|nr:DUF5641 domain-containing protein [Trichonephila clavipes]